MQARGGNFDFIVLCSMAFSIISILVTLISAYTQKHVLYSKGYAIVSFDVTGAAITGNISRCQRNIYRFKNEISSMLGLERELVEFVKPYIIAKGLRMTVLIHVNRVAMRDGEYEKILNDAIRSGELAKIMMSGWKTKGVVVCKNLVFEQKESKMGIANTISIKSESNNVVPPSTSMHTELAVVALPTSPSVQTKGGGEEENYYSDSSSFTDPCSPTSGNAAKDVENEEFVVHGDDETKQM